MPRRGTPESSGLARVLAVGVLGLVSLVGASVPRGPQQADAAQGDEDHGPAAKVLDGEFTHSGEFDDGEATIDWSLSADDALQRWELRLTALEGASVALVDAAGTRQAAREIDGGEQTAALENLHLLPGTHRLHVAGDGTGFTLAATPLGVPNQFDEREPNDDVVRARELGVDETHTGTLPDDDDDDVYRFRLTANEHVRIELDAPGDGAFSLALARGESAIAQIDGENPGDPLAYEAWLEPGGYTVTLQADVASSGTYGLTRTRLNPFTLPVDREPNDTPHHAAPMPPDFVVEGQVDRNDDDWYGLPELAESAEVKVRVDGDVDVDVLDGEADQWVTSERSDDGVVVAATLPSSAAHALRVSGSGEYRITLDFDPGPSAQAIPADLPVDLSIDFEQTVVAAYRTQGQRIAGEVAIRNRSAEPLDLTLDSASSEFGWTSSLAEQSVTVGAGETVSVPVSVFVQPDARPDRPVQIAARARSADGASVAADMTLHAEREIVPVNPEQSYPVPAPLRGGLNVAWTGLGATVAPNTDDDLATDQLEVHDGLAVAGLGLRVRADDLPMPLTIDLAGDELVPVAGFALDPRGRDGVVGQQVREFEVLVSIDGATFESVYSGELTAHAVEQFVVLDQPAMASHAQLVVHSGQDPDAGRVVLGEWKVIAAPGWNLAPSGSNLADPALGGHVVRCTPQCARDWESAQATLTEDADVGRSRLDSGTAVEWVIGFHNNRAAEITGVEWIDAADSDPAHRLSELQVWVSLESPVGPWRRLGTRSVDDGTTTGPATLNVAEPTWARFVRFTGRVVSPDDERVDWWMPETIRVRERQGDAEYRSILGEWGDRSGDGIYELLVPQQSMATATEVDDNDTRDTAQVLSPDDTVAADVIAGEDEDWYLIVAPPTEPILAITMEGDPALGVDVALQDEAGQPVPLVAEVTSPRATTYRAEIVPGATYWLRVIEPPRSVIFAFDTSTSVHEYIPAIYRALAIYAEGVVPGRDVANLLPFDETLLVAGWAEQPSQLQVALNDYPQTSNSSDAEVTLIAAADGLADRPGTRAIVLITDAESDGYDQSADMWSLFGQVHPRIFPVGVYGSSVAEPRLMQDWADVNGGHYAYVHSRDDMDIAFDRASTWLRRPSAYTVRFAGEPRPVPGSIQVVSEGGPGSAANAAIEIILDTSGSMRQQLDTGQTRAEVAKSAMVELVTNQLPAGTIVALRTFGDTPDSCDTNLVVPVQPLDPASVARTINELPVVDLVRTPIGASLAMVADDLRQISGPKIVVLVTDGEETCDGDPAAAISSLLDQGVDVHVNIVGFALDDDALRATFQEWAQLGQGSYFDATNAAELGDAITRAVQAPYRVLDPDGAVVASGTIGGDPVEAPPGVYTLEVLTDPVIRIEDVIVEPGGLVSVPLIPPEHDDD